MLDELIEVGTADKVCWGCDTWTSEECYGALLSLRHVLACVLASKVGEGYVCLSDAHVIADNILYNNVKNYINYSIKLHYPLTEYEYKRGIEYDTERKNNTDYKAPGDGYYSLQH